MCQASTLLAVLLFQPPSMWFLYMGVISLPVSERGGGGQALHPLGLTWNEAWKDMARSLCQSEPGMFQAGIMAPSQSSLDLAVGDLELAVASASASHHHLSLASLACSPPPLRAAGAVLSG